MRIQTTTSEFELPAEFAIQLNLTNVLLTDQGEQSLPITLPPTPTNLALVGWSHRIDSAYKPITDLSVLLTEGFFVRQCNMGIHSVHPVDGISCTLYLGTGDFYSKIEIRKLSTLPLPTVVDPSSTNLITRVNYLIDYLKAEYVTPTEEAIFKIAPVETSKELKFRKGTSFDITRPLLLNGLEWYYGSRPTLIPDLLNVPLYYFYLTAFEAEYEQKYRETIDSVESVLTLDKGYGMTPFIKLDYLLTLIFSSYGYNFVANNTYSIDTCIANNVADALYGGVLNFKQLVPNVTIKEFLSFIGKTYAINFVQVDTFTFKAIPFSSSLTLSADLDLSQYLSSSTTLGASEFKQVSVIVNEIPDTSFDDTDQIEEINITIPVYGDIIKTTWWAGELMPGGEPAPSTEDKYINVGDIIHLNSQILYEGKLIAENIESSSKIQLIEVSSNYNTPVRNQYNNTPWSGAYYKAANILYYQQKNNVVPERSTIEEVATILKINYWDYIQFKKYSNIPIEVEMYIPSHILENLNINTPKLLMGQKVMIEKIEQTLGTDENLKVTLRTLRPFKDR